MVHEDHSGAADEAQAVATLLVVSMCFSKENEKFSADAPQVQKDSVEAVQSLLQERGSMLRSREWIHACRSEARRWLR